MVDTTLERTAAEKRAAARAKALGRHRIPDAVFERLTQLAAVAVLLILGGVILSLVRGAMPVFENFGLEFLTGSSWNPAKDRFGALATIYGTVVSSLIALGLILFFITFLVLAMARLLLLRLEKRGGL